MGFFSFFSKEKKETLDKGLSKTKESVFGKIARAVAGKSKVDDEVLDNLEEVLITSDVGVETTLNIIKRIEKRAASDKYVNTQELNTILRDEIAALLTENNSEDVADFDVPIEKKPYVIMVVGVNGVPDAPNEVLLVLDGSTGQNAFEQAKQFTLATEVTAMAITKLDGTAKGGVVIGISDQFKIPVKYIGLGEGMEDLQVFRKKEFVDSLFGENA